ncbi:thyrostimulin alpha-2 subunit-like [Pollicipes pollicipes]|uniref:thyrostimulin alpha-2 subunit-like n=1 Tax=Pollicipes pollicipes TaxID=41117 RepID=UPI00188495A0|nr:thyrostimulin alpha-2 subunit-like [Pollicipes pollicipes]
MLSARAALLLLSLVSSSLGVHLSDWESPEQEEAALENTDLLTDDTVGPGAAQDQLHPSSNSLCELVGHTQRVQVSGCAPVELTANACSGSCGSYAQPSSWQTRSLNPRHLLTSIGQCCNIMETKDVVIKMECFGGPKHFTIKSATSCACFHCKKA